MMTGREAVQYQVDRRGVTKLKARNFRSGLGSGRPGRGAADEPRSDRSRRAYADVTDRALSSSERLDTAIDGVERPRDAFPDEQAREQLRMVARLIAAGRNQLGVRRQVFFVAMGGFDNHNALATKHPGLLAGIDGALSRVPLRHRGTRCCRPGHHVHGIGLRSDARRQRRRQRPRLGKPPHRDGRRRTRSTRSTARCRSSVTTARTTSGADGCSRQSRSSSTRRRWPDGWVPAGASCSRSCRTSAASRTDDLGLFDPETDAGGDDQHAVRARAGSPRDRSAADVR